MRYVGSSISKKCAYCTHALIEIDYYKEMLVGCLDRNRWGRPADKRLVLELLENDLEAPRAIRRRQS